MTSNLRPLIKALGYEFSDQAFLELALTHRSCGSKNNERLEFLGDSLLNCMIAEALYHQFPKAKEGKLSRLRAGLVKGVTLAEIAREKNLGDYLRLGSGELKSGGFNRDSILADAVEAIIGAIYLDSDFDVCRERVLNWYSSRLEGLSLDDTHKDAKTRLQEYLQSRRSSLPVYNLTNVEGESHEQVFYIECKADMLKKPTFGEGSSRRIAEQKAAAAALEKLGVDK